MAFLDFSDKLSVNVPTIDNQHKKLIGIINDLHAGMAAGKGKVVLDDILTRLIEYVDVHFSTEEKLMAQYNYPDAKSHETQHINLTTQVGQLYAKVKEGKLSVTIETMEFLKEWLNNHILETDKKLGKFLSTKGVK
jgi:hemerythrin-like metal-binding protein